MAKPQLLIKMMDPAELKPYEKNPRLNDKAVDAVARSLTKYGFRQPIVVDRDLVIVAGHTRWKAALKLKLSRVPVHIAEDLTPEEAKAYRIADNQTASLAEWETELLATELTELDALDFDMTALGFSEADLEKMMAGPDPASQQDDIPEPPAKATTRPGDVWILGPHRLKCGDSESEEDVADVLAGTKPFLMITDPPYGVKYDPEWRLRSGVNKEHQTRAEGTVSNDDKADWTKAWELSPATVAYVWHSALYAQLVASNLQTAKYEVRSQIIWAKTSLVIGRGHYHWQHEPCWYAARGSAKWSGDRKQSTLWSIPNMHRTQGDVDDGHTIHSTQKPVECMARPMRNHGTKDDLIYDPFLGSGTTIIAAEQLGRVCYGQELDPIYCDVIVERWQNFTGEKAVRKATARKK